MKSQFFRSKDRIESKKEESNHFLINYNKIYLKLSSVLNRNQLTALLVLDPIAKAFLISPCGPSGKSGLPGTCEAN